ncbi:hypothetical protein HBB16_09910 [Pseudonocardia sp. MCCB 268]|nr:hypothetical protein [Pseudonocardia cytotoxica]
MATAIDNTLAGVCLAHFHPTTTSAHIAWRGPVVRRRRAPERDDADVHVLDRGHITPTGRTGHQRGRAGHLRRATWRYQPVGPGRQQRRWTWVRATIVGSRFTSARSTVYRLTEH